VKNGNALISSYLILNITTGMIGGAMQIAVPCFAMALGASSSELGLIRGISGLGMLLLVIPAGFIVDHVGSKRLFLIGAIAGTIATFCLLFAVNPMMMVLIMGLSGLFQSLKMTALNASFYSDIKSIGIEKSGWFKGSMSIGLTFIGPVAGGLLIDHLPYRIIFPVLAAGTLIPIILVYVFHDDRHHRNSSGNINAALGKQLRDFKELIADRSLYLPLLTEILSTGCFTLFSTFIIVLAVKILKLPTTITSLLLTIEGSIFIITVFTAGPLIKLLSTINLYLVSIFFTIVALITLTFAQSFSVIIAATVILGFGLGMLNLVTSSRLALLKGDKGKSVGLFSAAVGIGISSGPVLGGIVASHFGNRIVFLTFIPLFLLLLGVAAVWEKKGTKEVEQIIEDTNANEEGTMKTQIC
jgi:predicted MFS family arabinose efflux permease